MISTKKKIIATWICIDSVNTSSYFPSAKGNSSDPGVQLIYWRCVLCFYSFARYFNPDAMLVLFSNQQQLPVIDGVDIKAILHKLNVRFFTTPFEFVTPESYYQSWRNQFYEFSILKFISTHPEFKPEDQFILLDSDCIITGNLEPLFESVTTHQCITYQVDYSTTQLINGLTRADMKEIFERYLNEVLKDIPEYHGGEFYASTLNVARQLSSDFSALWGTLLLDHSAGKKKLNEEAHVLSLLFRKNNFYGGQANQFIKRLWTDPSVYRNVKKEDEHLLIWHLPAEKRRGFRKLYHWLKEMDFNLYGCSELAIKNKLKLTFMVPQVPLRDRPFYSAKRLVQKFLHV